MTPVTESYLPKPEFLIQAWEPTEAASADRVETAAAPVFQKAAPATPPRPAPQSLIATGSPSVLASPIQPMHDSHDAKKLLEEVPNRYARKLKGKSEHAVCLTDSAVKHSRVFARIDVAQHVSKRTRALQLNPSEPRTTLELEPGLELTVTEPDKVEVFDKVRRRKREFGFHRHDGRKSPYPIKGDGVILASKHSKVSPKDLFEIMGQYRKDTRSTAEPVQFLQKKIEELTNPSPDKDGD